MARLNGKDIFFPAKVNVSVSSLPTEEKTVSLDMASGDQEVIPSVNKVLTKAIIKKPETLRPENIKEGVEIGGVVGTHPDGVTPSGEIELTENNKTYDVTQYASATVNVASSGGGDNLIAQRVSGNPIDITADTLEGVTNIADYAFHYERYVKSVEMPESITSIGQYAFAYAQVSRVVLSPNISVIPAYAFCYSHIEHLSIPESVTAIQSNAFNRCSHLKTIQFPDTPITYGNMMLSYCDSLESLNFPSGAIAQSSVASVCSNLKTLTIGEGITSIATQAFTGNYLLETIYYNAISVEDCQSRTSIFRGSGRDVEGGAKFYIGRKVKRIPAYLLCDDYNYTDRQNYISEVIFENGSVCESIGFYAFRIMYNLRFIDLTGFGESTPFPTLENEGAFQYCGRDTEKGTFEIRVPLGRKAELAAMTNWSTYVDKIVEV